MSIYMNTKGRETMKPGEWVYETETGQLGTIRKIEGPYVTILVKDAVILRYIGDLRKSPVVLYQADIKALIELALQTKDKEWFTELSKQLKVAAL
jgi:hypothetical protein